MCHSLFKEFLFFAIFGSKIGVKSRTLSLGEERMAVRGEGRPLHACVNSTNYFYIIVFYTVNSLLQQHTKKHVTYGK